MWGGPDAPRHDRNQTPDLDFDNRPVEMRADGGSLSSDEWPLAQRPLPRRTRNQLERPSTLSEFVVFDVR
jgi:hypothetical protein